MNFCVAGIKPKAHEIWHFMVFCTQIPKMYSKFFNTGLLDIYWRNNEMMEVHRKMLIYDGVVPIVPCATCRQTQKIEGKQLIVGCFKFRSVEGDIVGLILKGLTEKQGWLTWLWWEYSKFLLFCLQGRLGLLQGEEALDRILNQHREPLPNGLCSSQHVVGCCWRQFLATVAVFMKKGSRKYL